MGLVAAEASGGEALEHLAKLLAAEGSALESLRDLEAALVRLGKNFCRKSHCLRCPVEGFCQVNVKIGRAHVAFGVTQVACGKA